METLAINQAGSGADLVSRIRAGDRQAEADLVERYNRGVRIIIRREVGDTPITFLPPNEILRRMDTLYTQTNSLSGSDRVDRCPGN